MRCLLSAFLEEVAGAEVRRAELESRIEAAKPPADEEEGAEPEETLSPAELKQLRDDLKVAKKKVGALRDELPWKIQWAYNEMDGAGRQRLALDMLRDDLVAQLDRYIAAHRQQIVAAVELWWNKYRVTLVSIEAERDAAARRLNVFVAALGYRT